MIEIRDATEGDLPDVLAIYNDVIATSYVLWREQPVSFDHFAASLDSCQRKGHAFIVAVEKQKVLGYGTYFEFRASPGYRYTVEHTLYVHAEHRGRGVGHELISTLLDHAGRAGIHVVVAGVDASNEGSIRFHGRYGFERVGLLPEVGHKFGRWLDLVLMQKFLDGPRNLPA